MAGSNAGERIADWLAATLSATRDLREILEIEAQALGRRVPAELQEISSLKERAVQSLTAHTEALEALCRESGILEAPVAARFEKLVKASNVGATQAAELLSGWQTLRELGAECQRLNVRNGSYVGLARRYTQRALEILYSQPDQARTYGPDGQTHVARTSRAFASA